MQHAAPCTPFRTAASRGRAAQRSRTLDRASIAAHIALAVLIAASLLVTIVSLASSPKAPVPASWGTVSVSQNATLWGVAEAHPIEGRTTIETIELIAAENGLTGSTIHAGQVLRVPVPAPSLAMAQR